MSKTKNRKNSPVVETTDTAAPVDLSTLDPATIGDMTGEQLDVLRAALAPLAAATGIALKSQRAAERAARMARPGKREIITTLAFGENGVNVDYATTAMANAGYDARDLDIDKIVSMIDSVIREFAVTARVLTASDTADRTYAIERTGDKKSGTLHATVRMVSCTRNVGRKS